MRAQRFAVKWQLEGNLQKSRQKEDYLKKQEAQAEAWKKAYGKVSSRTTSMLGPVQVCSTSLTMEHAGCLSEWCNCPWLTRACGSRLTGATVVGMWPAGVQGWQRANR